MRIVASFAIAALIALPVSGAARAADSITVPLSTAAALPLEDSAGFDWSGFYASVYGIGRAGAAGGQVGVGLGVGVNALLDFVLVGGEVAVEGLDGPGGASAYVQVLGRTGLLVTDDIAVYGAAGYGVDVGTSGRDLLLGGGVEMAVSDALSLRGQYLHSVPLAGGGGADEVTFGASVHF
jgi:outer membrane immunogenic protein